MDTAILVIYGAALALLAGFGVHRYFLLYLYVRHRAETPRARALPSPAPRVTVQLPVYNEMYVVERLIRAACAIDYPADRLEIQVIDDSTDETSEIVRRLCEEERVRGRDVVHIRRGARDGFKAGALAAGLERARGEYVAIFDADFVPPPGILRAVVPYFEDERLGMAQVRWGHLNRSYSLLTQLQSIFLDGHFVIEQTARNRSGRFFNFNGTAGIWRRRAIEDAGGWQHDTLTEDLDLSYRAQLRGWRFLYLPHLVAPAELPVEMRAFKTQQHRWVKGSIQTARKLLPRILLSPIPWRVKLESVLHLSNNLAYVAMIAPSVLILPVLAVGRRLQIDWHLLAFGYFVLFFSATASVASFYVVAQREILPDWRARIRYLPPLMALGVGLSVNNARAVLEGLFERGREFVRTPKYAIVSQRDGWRDKRYVNRVDPLGVVEVLLAAYFIVVLVYTLRHGLLLFVPFAVLFLCGFLYVGGLSLFEHLGRPALRGGRVAPSP